VTPIPEPVRAAILDNLARIESEHEVQILFACESGSRAWGFASPDSDYDVRFIYVHSRDWYLSLERGRDVVEVPISGELDIAGWDLRKALGLMRAGNATLGEWMDSPIVYREAQGFRSAFLELSRVTYRRDRLYEHYRALAAKQWAQAHTTDPPRIKKFLYALRSALACEWCAARKDMPPMRLVDLADAMVSNADERVAIDLLVEAKAALMEKSGYVVPTTLIDSLGERISRMGGLAVEKVPPAPLGLFDEFFRRWVPGPTAPAERS